MLILYSLAGCQSEDEELEEEYPETVTYDAKWNERNRDIYRYLLSKLDKPSRDRIYFVTTTPMTEWGDTGEWETIPEDEIQAFPDAALYRPASEAYLKDDNVLEKDTDAAAWMQWMSVISWISDTEVEVEEGIWCCPLGGGASRKTYEKVNGEWTVKDYGPSWVS
ncbi:hypothetical protein GC176_09410 [bacterium]|nr:hypothetical protein [bacterium]